MKSSQGTEKAAESYVGGHKQTVVDSQPAAEAAVSGDPHEEGFDFGHHVAAGGRVIYWPKGHVAFGNFTHTKPYTGKTTITGEFLEKPKLSVQHRFDDVTDRP